MFTNNTINGKKGYNNHGYQYETILKKEQHSFDTLKRGSNIDSKLYTLMRPDKVRY